MANPAAPVPIPVSALMKYVSIMMEDINGDHIYSNEKAILGYMPTNEHMVLLPGINYDGPPEMNMTTLGKLETVNTNLGPPGDDYRADNPYLVNPMITEITMVKLCLLNMRSLMSGTSPHKIEDALLISALRTRWLKLGCLFQSLADRAVQRDEVTYAKADDQIVLSRTEDDLMIADAAAYVAHLNFMSSEAGGKIMEWATTNAELVWNMTEHLMRSRGHHYKEDFSKMANTMYASSSPGNEAWPTAINMLLALRTAIHPFGIRALPVMAYHFIWHGKIGLGMVKRITGASNGFAAATTAYAGMSMISSEPWYAKYVATYENQIALLQYFAREMLNNRYAFHESASLYGITPIRHIMVNGISNSMADVDLAVSAIAPVLQGFIEWSKEFDKKSVTQTFTFAGAKVLERRAGANPIQVVRLKALLTTTIKLIEDAATSSEAITETFPMMKIEEK